MSKRLSRNAGKFHHKEWRLKDTTVIKNSVRIEKEKAQQRVKLIKDFRKVLRKYGLVNISSRKKAVLCKLYLETSRKKRSMINDHRPIGSANPESVLRALLLKK